MAGLRLTLCIAIMAGTGCMSCAAAQSVVPSSTISSAKSETYGLDAGDKLRITVFGEPNLSGEFSVSDEGRIAFPLIGAIDVRGKSVVAAQEMIQSRLADGYLRAPQVSLEVVRYRPYYVYGEVARAGEYPFASGLTIQQAIAAAGGYTYRATRKTVFLRRSGEAVETRLDVRTNPIILIRPGDTLRIGERHF